MMKEASWTWLVILAMGGAAIALLGPWAASQGGDNKALEKNLDAGLRDAIDHGATIFNKQGDYAGCYRVFEGALLTARPLLSNYPALQRKIEIGLADANMVASMHDRAHALRKVIQEVRVGLNPAAADSGKAKWDRVDMQAKQAPPPNPNMARVKGKVTLGDTALTYGFITFINKGGTRFSANIQKDGAYVFPKGIPPDDYAVVIEDTSVPAAPGEVRRAIPPQYTIQATSPLHYTANKGESVFNAELTAK